MVAAATVTQLAVGVGFSAVLAYFALYLRGGLGLTAFMVSVVVGLRTFVQLVCYAPAGRLTDRLGGVRAAALACITRGMGFALLAATDQVPALVTAAVLVGVGGSLYTPAGQTLLAALPGEWPRRGYAWYIAAGQAAAAAGPLMGLALLADSVPRTGFTSIAALAAVLWFGGGLVFLVLSPGFVLTSRPTHSYKMAIVLRDKELLRLVGAVWPITLLITQATIVVPQVVVEQWLVAAFAVTGAAVAMVAQLPRLRALADEHGLVAGFAAFAAAYLLVAWATPGPAQIVLAGALSGWAQGMLLPAVFARLIRLAPSGAVGAYAGVLHTLTGAIAFLAGLAIGIALDAGPAGRTGAVLGLAVCAALAVRRA
ncbi:MFS transporter [Actinocrispum sp. NPDC049592]|uniref:MFS transporter n=1 Tax=Actinocrispum sp. NPDC049592 TaxID=3154835 RepID=UPI003446343C